MLTYRPPTLDHIDQRDRSRLYSYDYYGVAGKRERYLPPPARGAAAPASGAVAVPLRRGDPRPHGAASALPAIWGLYGSFDVDLRGLYPTELSRLDLLLRAVEGSPGHLRLLRIGAVSRVIARHSEGFEDLVPLATLAGFGTEPLRVYRVPDPLPRAYVVSGARVANGDAAYVALVDPASTPAGDRPRRRASSRPPDPAFTGSAHIAALGADRARLEVELSAPGWAVLVDGYDPAGAPPWTAARRPSCGRTSRSARSRWRQDATWSTSLYRPRSAQVGLALTGAGLLIAAAPPCSRGGAPPLMRAPRGAVAATVSRSPRSRASPCCYSRGPCSVARPSTSATSTSSGTPRSRPSCARSRRLLAGLEPLHSFGHPLLANPHTQALYPSPG